MGVHGPGTKRTARRRPPALQFKFANSYASLPETFFVRLPPTPVAEPRLVRLNQDLAERLGLDPVCMASAEGVTPSTAAACRREPSRLPRPMPGNFVPRLGDGRAILLGEIVDTAGRRRDIQLKGAGADPVLPQWRRAGGARPRAAGISRQRGDGRARHPDDARSPR